MLGDFITRLLIMLFGYAYPAFECFKTVEKNRADIDQLRFWCQYWIIVALLAVFERIGDIFVSWVPMYGEMKLAFIIYLWHPRTKGTNYVYEVFLRPYFAKHETELDRKLLEMRARAWDMATFYWQSFANQGQARIFEMLRYVAAQSYRPSPDTAENNAAPNRSQPDQQDKRPRPPPAPMSMPPRMSSNRAEFQSPRAVQAFETGTPTSSKNHIAVNTRVCMEDEDGVVPTSPVAPGPTPKGNAPMLGAADETLYAARLRLRRAHRPEQESQSVNEERKA